MDLVQKLRRRTEWLVTKPRAVAVLLAAVGLAVWHSWITTLPLASGDWNWQAPGSISVYFPFPSVWNSTLGLAGENRFVDAFRFPVYALDGMLSALGASWASVEKIVYFIPFAVLLPVAGWLLAREILGKTRWALLTPVLLLGNAYFVMEANTEVPLTLAEAFGCLALLTFIWSMKRLSLRWGLVTGLLVAISAVFDLRPTYLTVLLITAYLILLTIAEPSWRLLRRRILLAAAAGLAFGGSQAFWILPLVTYHGHAQLPIPPQPNFNITTLEHGIAGVSSFWTYGRAADLVQAPLNPWFMVLPIVAMVPLLRRRVRLEFVWLALAAVVCAFLSKTNTPPFGGVYDWLYSHVPGFDLFREGSKFLYPVAIAYAILIPAAFRSMVEIGGGLAGATRRTIRVATVALLVVVLGGTGSVLLVLEQGKLGLTTTPLQVPRAFSEMTALLSADHQPGSVLWLGSPVYKTSDVQELLNEHRYVLSSATHPIANLSGNALTFQVNRRDPLQYFCPIIKQAYCYLTPSLFPYLANMAGATYVVSPADSSVGKLRPGVTREWVRQQVTAMFGAPLVLGNVGAQLLVWHIHSTQPVIASYPAVGLVDSGPWSLPNVLPALQAMGVPAAYQQSLDVRDYPPAPAGLPDSIAVLPRVNGGCQSSSAAQVGIMAETTSATLPVTIGGTSSRLSLLSRSSRLPGWGLFGPTSIPTGLIPIETSSADVQLGPCVAWSALTGIAFGVHPSATGPVHLGADGERLTASSGGTAGPWTELRRGYDGGWLMRRQAPTAVADGLFNLYYQPVAAKGGYVFTFSTLKWEHRGQAVAALSVLLALLLIWRSARRERRQTPVVVTEIDLESRAAPMVGGFALAFLGLTAIATTLAWFGVPSRAPWTAITSDPYRLDIVFGFMALVLLLFAMVVRLVEHVVRLRYVRVTSFVLGRPRQVATLVVAASLLVAGCAGVGQNAAHPLGNVPGAALTDGRVQSQAKNSGLCIADYTEALRSFPTLLNAYIGRARCYLGAGQNAVGAVHDLDQALKLSPGNAVLLFLRAEADAAVGDVSAAANDYRAAADAPASTPSQIVSATDGLIAIGELGDAASVVQAALIRFPIDPVVRLAVADLAVANGADSQATAALAEASQLAIPIPSDVGIVLSRTCSLEVARLEYQAAVATCQRSVQLTVGAFGAYDSLAAAEAALGQLNQAIVDMTSAIGAFQGAVGPNSQPTGVDGFGLNNLYEARGRLYAENDQPQLAVDDFRAALGVLPPGEPDIVIRLRLEIRAAANV
jgi:tetratricopeptide (TPR) repeat protein